MVDLRPRTPEPSGRTARRHRAYKLERLAMVTLFAGWGAPALATEVGAIIEPDAAVDIAADRDKEDAAAVRTRVRAFARGDTGDNGTWFLEVRGYHEILAGEDIEGAWDPRMGESGWEGAIGGPFRLRIGNVIERWGKLDLLPTVDVLNARDLRAGPLTPTDWQRLPAPMATISVEADWIRSETTYIPFGFADRLSMRDTDWSFVRQGMLDEQAKIIEQDEWTGDSEALFGEALPIAREAIEDLDPTFRRGIDEAINVKNLPQALFWDAELAERIEFSGKGFDAALMAATIRNRQPQSLLDEFLVGLLQDERLPNQNEIPLTIEALLGPVDVQWPRTFVGGAEFGTVVDAFGLRAEGVVLSDKVYRTRWFKGGTSPSVAGGVGIDYSRGSWLYISLEGRYERFLEPPRQAMLLMAPENVHLAGGFRISAIQDRLQFVMGGSYDVVFSETLLRPTVAYRLSDAVELHAGAAILEGPTKPAESLTDLLTYRGGPISYWGQNDVVTFGFAWIL